MLQHEIVSRAFLKARGRRVTEFYGLPEAEFRELALLAHHCEALGLKASALTPLGLNGRSGVRLSLSGNRSSYGIVLSPTSVYLESGRVGEQPRQVFRDRAFNHLIAGQLFGLIKKEEAHG